jgi:hypothetical protein
MNMETFNISLIKGRQNVRRYCGKVAGAACVVIHRLMKPSSDSRTKSSREARLEKERHQALATAQMQSTRFFR